MNKAYPYSLLVATALLGAACSNVRQAPVEERQDAEVAAQQPAEPVAAPAAQAPAGKPLREEDDSQWEQLPGAEAPAEAAAPAPTARVSDNPAVLALLDDAQLSLGQAAPEAAASSIERALRLEPKNPWLWHRLAVLKLEQGNWRLAIALAQKSNSLAAGQPALRQANTDLLRQAEQNQ